jgi:type I restriction enzyme M protein
MTDHANFIWSIAESLRGPFKPNEYGSVVLPFTILRRLDAALADTKAAVLVEAPKVANAVEQVRHVKLTAASGQAFYNTSPFDMAKLVADPADVRANIAAYIAGFSPNVRDIFERFKFDETLSKLQEKNKLFAVTEKFAKADFHPSRVSNYQMGLVFEELIRWANEKSNETAGDHYTPREVIRLMVELLFVADDDALAKPGTVRSIYDPTAGTGGMLSVADEYLHDMNPGIQLSLYGQDYNDASYAICKADMVIKGQGVDNIALGDTLTEDRFEGKEFDYGLSNPPFGVDWKDQRAFVDDEHARLGFHGRFGPGTPAVSDGAMLFLLHLVSKMRKPEAGGARAAIVLNGSPLFSGGAGGGESNIRKWLLDQDLVEAIIALPKDMFYNTGIATYIWVLTNRKDEVRKGKVQLIDGTKHFRKLRKAIGSKRVELGPDDIAAIVQTYAAFEESKESKTFANEDFLYRTITVERPLRDEMGNVVTDSKGRPKADAKLRDTENVPWSEDVGAYFEREVKPYAEDAWIDHAKTKEGAEIPFTRHFYEYIPPRPLEEIDRDLEAVMAELRVMLSEVER